ncbi:unnamed protein product, partial [Rotaria magnacalcarata]
VHLRYQQALQQRVDAMLVLC